MSKCYYYKIMTYCGEDATRYFKVKKNKSSGKSLFAVCQYCASMFCNLKIGEKEITEEQYLNYEMLQ